MLIHKVQFYKFVALSSLLLIKALWGKLRRDEPPLNGIPRTMDTMTNILIAITADIPYDVTDYDNKI